VPPEPGRIREGGVQTLLANVVGPHTRFAEKTIATSLEHGNRCRVAVAWIALLIIGTMRVNRHGLLQG
jgi:hypothetical protein